MKVIFTGDFQAEWSNLDLCEKAWNEVLSIVKKKKLNTIVFLGDGKQHYNPIDGRVVKWWHRAIGRAIKRNIEVIYVLGNHDRFGRYAAADDWLSVLKKAGAIVFNKPGIHQLDNGRLFILPYSSNSAAKENAKNLLNDEPDKNKDILCFHHDLNWAKYNQQGSKSDGRLTTSDIGSDHYRACVSGHIHLPQERENVYYVGSPFCHDWGEVNQRKRYLVIRKNKIESIYSGIPGFFDPNINGFGISKPKDWKGRRIRISVSCDASKDYGRRLEKAKRRAERKYTGAIISIVPKFKDRSYIPVGIKFTDSDDRKIKEYVKRTYRGRHRHNAVSYMLKTISNFTGGLRSTDEVIFTSARGTNVLPFKRVTTDFVPGIHVIQGINKDRNNKSNGSGKTSLIQLLPIAMFGSTFKDQSHDEWSNNRRIKEQATVEVSLKKRSFNHKKKVKIIRGRRPPLLQMFVNGKDVSVGMKTTDKSGTQAQIEQVTGFTWQTLANAVYIDRTVADAFLSGTKKQRTEVLSRFQNLERFDKALQLVKKDKHDNVYKLDTLNMKLASLKGSLEESKESLSSVKELSNVQIKGAYAEYIKYKRNKKKWYKQHKSKIKNLKRLESKLETKHKKLLALSSGLIEQTTLARGKYNQLVDEVKDWLKLKDSKNCPVCLQVVSNNWIKAHSKMLEHRLKECKKEYHAALKKSTDMQYKESVVESKFNDVQRKLTKIDNIQSSNRNAVAHARNQYMELGSDSHSAKVLVTKVKSKIKDLEYKIEKYKYKYKRLRSKDELYQYVVTAFSRDGIPAFLNREVCPVLNEAASYYAEAFSDNEIQVKFLIDEGEFVPLVINTKGGDGIKAQSTGERALAGLIASFALREIAPRCNLLILDEPGDGLDVQTASQFAKALKRMTKRLGSIWITSHNQALLSELSGEHIITITKENGISKVSSTN